MGSNFVQENQPYPPFGRLPRLGRRVLAALLSAAFAAPFLAEAGFKRNKEKGGADIFLDHSGSTYIIPKLSLYSTGLMPPKVILIRSSLYQ